MRRTLLVVLVASGVSLLIVSRVAAQASDSWIGTWTLNVDQSSWQPAELAQKSETAKITAAPDGNALVTDAVDSQGKKTHTEITYKFDGKDYDVKGAADAKTTRTYTRVDDRAYTYATKVNGLITTTSRVAVTPDGKTRTVVTTGRDAQGRIIHDFLVFNRAG